MAPPSSLSVASLLNPPIAVEETSPDGLHSLYDIHEDHHDDGVGMEFQSEVERIGTEISPASLKVEKSTMPPIKSAIT